MFLCCGLKKPQVDEVEQVYEVVQLEKVEEVVELEDSNSEFHMSSRIHNYI
jgi:hypothetical protein